MAEFIPPPPVPDEEESVFTPPPPIPDEEKSFVPPPPVPDEETTPISGKLLGTETTPPVGSNEPEALPVMEKTDPLFERTMADVEAGQMAVNQFLLPSKVDAFSMLTQAERGGQVAVAEVRARQARERLNKIGPDPFNPDYYRAREEEQNLTARANALNLRFQADTPLGRMRAEDAERVQREEQMRKDFEASGEGPGVVGTFLEQVAGMATNVVGGALRTVAPSIGGAAGDAVIREGGRMTELANVDQSLGGQIGRGAGTVAGLLVGNPAGAVPSTIAVGLKGAMDAFSQTLQQTGNASEADRAAMHTFPALALYMATGMAGARAAAGMTPANAAPATKALAGFAGAAIANVGTTGAVALAEGTDYGIQELTADTLLAIFHAKGEYSRGVSEQARERAKVELLSRGFAEKQIDRPFELGENTPSFRVIVEPAKPPPLMDSAAMQAEVDQVTPPPVLPVETEPAPTIEQVAEQHGMKYDGQTELPGNPHQFTDERTGSTIIVTGEFTPEKLTAKTEQLDQRFGLEPRERQLGPGAANIEEPIANREPVGAWNAKVDEQRAARGLEPLASEARRADETTWADAEKRMEENPNYARDLVDALNDGKKESVSDTEQAALLREMLTLREVRDMATDRAFDEQTYSPEERAAFLEEAKAAEDRLERTEEADRKSGTAQGRALRIRRLMAYEDFTLAGLMGKARRAKGEDLTPEETATLKTKADRFKKAKDKFEERMEEAETGQPIDEAIRQIEAEASKDPEFTPEVRSLADRIILKLEKAAKGASERLRGLMSQLGSAPDVSVVPKVIKELALMAASDISRLGLKATLKFTRWATKMVKEFGNKIEPYLKQAWDQANADIDNQVAGTRTRKPKEVKAAITKENAGARADEIATQMKAKGGKISEMRGDIQKLVETLVRGGIKQRDPLVDAVHEVLKGVDSSITRRQTADAISGYGDFKPLNKDAVKAEVRDIKQQLQLVAKIQDIQSKIPLQKSGIERQKLSDESRRLTAELNENIKKFGVVVSDPATQLRTMLAATETRLTNRIKDLRAEIAAGEQRVKTKTDRLTNERITALKKELAEVEAQHDAVFGKREVTPEQRAKAALAAAKRTEAVELERLEKAKKGVFDKPLKTPAARSAEVDAIRTRTEALREERIALEEAANPPLSKAQKALDAALVERERLDQMLAGEIAPAKKLPREALTELENDVRAEIASMRELAAEIRRSERPKTDPEIAKENAQVKALEKAAAEYERRLNEADFSSKGKKEGPDTARVARARALRDAARTALEAARKLAHPPRTKEQIAIQNYKAMAARKVADLQDRITREDFSPRPKKPKLDLAKDPEAVKAKAEMERVRKEFNEKRTQWQRSNRSVTRKFWDGIKEVAATSRSLITSADVSAPFRQGGFLLLGDMVFHPVRAAKQLGTMFRQLFSEKQFEQAQAAIMLRPNAKLYEQSGLYLADMSGKLSGREESMRSNLAEKIPLVKYIVRGSNRAYAGFLNRQRADTFDAMIESFGGADKVTPEEAAAIADFVNKATGRGTVGGMERSADALARYFFSPRFLASRFQLVTGQPFVGAARRAVAQQYAKFAVGLSAIYGLALLNGATVEKDPRSADFGKAKFGDTRIDPLSGLAQVTTFLARMMSGKTKQGSNVKAQKRSDTFTRFARTKLAPIPGVAADFAAEKTLDFKKPTVAGSAARLTVPLSYQDAPGVFKEHGAVKGTILEALNLLGMGLQRYNK